MLHGDIGACNRIKDASACPHGHRIAGPEGMREMAENRTRKVMGVDECPVERLSTEAVIHR